MPRSASTVRVGRGRRDHLVREPVVGPLGVEGDHGVDVGRGAADVDDCDVADARALVVDAVGQHLDARQHDVGGRALDQPRQLRAAGGESLARDHVPQELLPHRCPRALGREHPDPRHGVVGEHVREPGEDLGDLVIGVDVAGDHHRPVEPRRGHRPRGLDQRGPVAAVGAAGQQHRDPVVEVRRAQRGASKPPRPAAPRRRSPRPPCRRSTSATRRPASAVTSASKPTTATRSPPPALEHASTSASARPGIDRDQLGPAAVDRVHHVTRRERRPLRASDHRRRSPRSTSSAFVYVEPTSTHRTTSPRRLSQVPVPGRRSGRRRSRCRR